MQISGGAQKILKVLHLLTISYWIGGAVALMTLLWMSSNAQSGDELFGMLKGMRLISVFVVVWLGALGSFFTGLVYSVCTNRGFFRHKWIILKWGITVYLMLAGMLLLGPWSSYLFERAAELGVDALYDPEFLAVQARHFRLEWVHMGLFIVAIVLSVYKPWELKEIIRRQKRFLPARVDRPGTPPSDADKARQVAEPAAARQGTPPTAG